MPPLNGASHPLCSERIRRYVMRVCLGCLEDWHAAEDATQETLLRAWMYWHTYDPEWRLESWLASIARRVSGCIKARGSRLRTCGLKPWHSPRVPATQLPTILIRERDAALMATVARLPRRYRELIQDRFFKRVTLREIANRAGVRMSAVDDMQRRVLRRMGDRLAKWSPDIAAGMRSEPVGGAA